MEGNPYKYFCLSMTEDKTVKWNVKIGFKITVIMYQNMKTNVVNVVNHIVIFTIRTDTHNLTLFIS